MKSSHLESFFSLSPEHVFQSVEILGYRPTGELLQLNSYENRVFDIKLEPSGNIISKFYRPHRWNEKTLLEEHTFVEELFQADVRTVPVIKDNGYIHKTSDNIFFSLYPKKKGRMPQEFLPGELRTVGKRIAQFHNVGAQKRFSFRQTMAAENYIPFDSLAELDGWVAPEVWSRYEEACELIMDFLISELNPDSFIRIHGDCHKGNLLHDGSDYFFVDFDDCINGPAVQDFWMLLSSAGPESAEEMNELLSGYSELRDFDDNELFLIPALRGLRIFSYAAWIARRWDDPVFPKLFPDFTTYNYWADEVERLESIAWTLNNY
ncbi:MAG: serine/threonine protein kinase [Bdellovibrionaceae bacterium]|nr:serine/threonine protein kinase [Pseudobdellovibrionaceae bacterium]